MNGNYPKFQIVEKIDSNLISEFENRLPKQLISLWSDFGFGIFGDGYLKIVNPNDYKDLLEETYIPVYKDPIVMFATAMSDLIVWENNYIILLDYRHGKSKVVESGFKFFLEDLIDEDFITSDLLGKNYFPAKEKLGELAFDECYGYVPLLGLGGPEKVDNLEIVKLKEHISIIAQTLGKVE